MRVNIPPFLFVLSLPLLFLSSNLSSLLVLGVPNFTTNQQHGIPCFINEDPSPDCPVWTRVCVVGWCPETMTKKGKKKGKGKGGETGETGKLRLEILNSIRRAQHMDPLLELPATGKLGGRTLLDSSPSNKKAMLDSPPSSDEDLLDIPLSPLPEVGGETLLDLAHLATTEAAILDISNLSIAPARTWESLLDQSLEEYKKEQEGLQTHLSPMQSGPRIVMSSRECSTPMLIQEDVAGSTARVQRLNEY
jgi:hypothetical protein